MGPGVDQPIAIKWSAAQEAALGGGLGAHGGPHPGLDPRALARLALAVRSLLRGALTPPGTPALVHAFAAGEG